MARAKTTAKFQYYMTKLRKASAFATAYLETVDPTLYAKTFVTCQRFGHDASNIAKSINKVLKLDRQNNVLSLLSAIWDWVIVTQHSWFCQTLKNFKEEKYYTPKCAQLIAKSQEFAGGCRVRMSTDVKAKIAMPERWIYDVKIDWETKKCQCSCRRSWQTKIPCGHVLAMIFDQHKILDDFIPWAYSCFTWMNQHGIPLSVLIISLPKAFWNVSCQLLGYHVVGQEKNAFAKVFEGNKI